MCWVAKTESSDSVSSVSKLPVIMHEINMHLYAARLEGHFDFEVLFKMKFTPQIWILYKFTNHTDKK